MIITAKNKKIECNYCIPNEGAGHLFIRPYVSLIEAVTVFADPSETRTLIFDDGYTKTRYDGFTKVMDIIPEGNTVRIGLMKQYGND